jgi:hypothetical protein
MTEKEAPKGCEGGRRREQRRQRTLVGRRKKRRGRRMQRRNAMLGVQTVSSGAFFALHSGALFI